MSYLARISARAAGPRANAPAVLPKCLGNGQTAAIARSEENGEEDETLSPMRTPAARPVRRQEADEAEEVSRQEVEGEPEAKRAASPKEMAREVQREADEEVEEGVVPLRRQEDEGEEELAPLRRQEEEGEEEVAPLRRQEIEEESEASPMRTIARQEEIPLEDTGQTAPPPAQAELEPDAEPPSQELAGDREPSDLQALHRDIPAGPGLSPPTPAAQSEPPENRSANRPLAETLASSHPQVPDFTDGIAIPHVIPQSTGAGESRTDVVIDQLDVVIHEPAVSAERSPPHRDRERVLRARYLRRL